MKHSQKGIASLIWLVLIVDADAHDWYTGKSDPVMHWKCCGKRDCRPLDNDEVRPARDGSGYFVKQPEPYSRNDPPTGEWFVPKDRVQASEDNQFHICETLVPTGRVGKLRMSWMCFFAPMSTSSIEQAQISN
jgi:hypothetical protein